MSNSKPLEQVRKMNKVNRIKVQKSIKFKAVMTKEEAMIIKQGKERIEQVRSISSIQPKSNGREKSLTNSNEFIRMKM